ncbi:uncharacterized protein J7T54_007042 [Emericellopsis cladophorae]|uniref:Uncharacterized protein n=1 Tax=Emericellopsis cladophorae TaxID=2686198 RepID=A0A9P9Y9E3_9HYPO|nr:uncharacterized protein J7T54_007042 [Emericellopsis cladophorae]KAI6785400.1 hypothetical protein J7T54_007042 [Emericellopsis cladophorae]
MVADELPPDLSISRQDHYNTKYYAHELEQTSQDPPCLERDQELAASMKALGKARGFGAPSTAQDDSPTHKTVHQILLEGVRNRLRGGPAPQISEPSSLKRKRSAPGQRDHDQVYKSPLARTAPEKGTDRARAEGSRQAGSMKISSLMHPPGREDSERDEYRPKECGHHQAGPPQPWYEKQHCHECLRAISSAGRRFQMITGSRNTLVFKPQTHEASWAQVPVVDEHMLFACGVEFKDLRRCLETASEKNGFRGIGLASCTFSAADRGFLSNKIGDWRYPGAKLRGPKDKLPPMAFTSSGPLSMQLCETNVKGPDGNTRTWMWLRIRKPMVHHEGPGIPGGISDIPDSEFIMAVPSLQVALLGDEYITCVEHLPTPPGQKAFVFRRPAHAAHGTPPPTPVSPSSQRSLTFQLSKDGIPSFGFSDKPAIASYAARHDFLHITGVGQHDADPMSVRQWWDAFDRQVRLQRWHWQEVAEAMSKYECILKVEALKGVDWVVLPPKASVATD